MTTSNETMSPLFGHPDEDGFGHINVYMKGKTEIGRKLSNLSHSPFISPVYGNFASMEGFYYWVKSGMIHDELKSLHGFEAKAQGRVKPMVFNERFTEILIHGLNCKLFCNVDILNGLMSTSLPLKHYYVYGNPRDKNTLRIVVPNGSEWLIDHYNSIRKQTLDSLRSGLNDDITEFSYQMR